MSFRRRRRRYKRNIQLTSNYEAFISYIPSIVDLAKQDVLPEKVRDDMYQLLSDMVPLFERVDEPANN